MLFAVFSGGFLVYLRRAKNHQLYMFGLGLRLTHKATVFVWLAPYRNTKMKSLVYLVLGNLW